MQEDKLFYSPRELADLLGVSIHTVYDWGKKQTGPRRIRLPNRKVRYAAGDVKDWLRSRQVGPGNKEPHPPRRERMPA